MSIDDIPFETTCHGNLAEFQAPSKEWLRVQHLPGEDTYEVTRFGEDKMPRGDPQELDAKALTKLLA